MENNGFVSELRQNLIPVSKKSDILRANPLPAQWHACCATSRQKGVKWMSEEHEARQPYKCAVCGTKFDSQEQLQQHLKSCTAKKS
jgi:hypothetical protein